MTRIHKALTHAILDKAILPYRSTYCDDEYHYEQVTVPWEKVTCEVCLAMKGHNHDIKKENKRMKNILTTLGMVDDQAQIQELSDLTHEQLIEEVVRLKLKNAIMWIGIRNECPEVSFNRVKKHLKKREISITVKAKKMLFKVNEIRIKNIFNAPRSGRFDSSKPLQRTTIPRAQ